MATTTRLAYTGAPVSFTVPVGVTSIAVDAQGASGGEFQFVAGRHGGGIGGRVQATITTTPGETLWLHVGGNGTSQNGWNGGGRVASTTRYGGGATDIRRGGQALSNRILVAGGGGSQASGGGAVGGHGGGATGEAGAASPGGAAGGGGGTQTVGGSFGGVLGIGGSSPSDGSANFGGAGGGGFYGGGRAGNDGNTGQATAGGGGGSSLVPAGGTTTTAGAQSFDGLLLLTYNQPPSAPTLLVSNGEALNKDATNRLPWQHADPDGDGQSGYDLRYRIVGAATWTTLNGSTPNQYRDIPAGTFAAGSYEWQVRTYDPAGLVGPYSGSGFFTAATLPAGPSITAPVNGETIGTATATLTWTAAAQTSYQVRKVADSAGTADTATVLYDSGEVVSSSVRSVALAFDVNSRYEHLQVRVKDAGLFSPWTSVRVLVSYTLPATALLSVVPDTTAYALAVQVLNPAPTNGQPARSFNRIYVTALSPGDSLRPMGVRKLAAASFVGSLFIDDRVASGVSYGFEVETVASNGTASMSDLVAEFRDLGTGGGGVTPGNEGDYVDADYAPADFN